MCHSPVSWLNSNSGKSTLPFVQGHPAEVYSFSEKILFTSNVKFMPHVFSAAAVFHSIGKRMISIHGAYRVIQICKGSELLILTTGSLQSIFYPGTS